MRNDFALLILSHGRADCVDTLNTFRRCGYTGRWYIIIDNEDSQHDKYVENFGEDHVIVFDKYKKSLEVETCDLPRDRKVVLFAREVCFDVANQLGLKYFLELDDDYTECSSRVVRGNGLMRIYTQDVESLIDETLDFLVKSHADCIAWAQDGDFCGGIGGSMFKNKVKRKMMNAFFCRTDKPFHFLGRINEDVNTYILEGSRGKLFLTVYNVAINQRQTQKNVNGMTDIYLNHGTYIKSFYSVIVAPSCVKVGVMGQYHHRMHHKIEWNDAVPKIIREDWRKPDANPRIEPQQLNLFE